LRGKKMAKMKAGNVPPTPKDKGRLYTRTQLGLKPQDYQKGSVKINGEEYLFITINNGKYMNELHADGVVHEVKKEDLVQYNPANFTKSKGRHIMVRFQEKGDREYEYIGDEIYICRYDPKRNKIIVG
jgi:hypothetical protein